MSESMVRPRKFGLHLPPCVYFKHSAYWLVKKSKWTRLGTTLEAALAAYARLYEAPKQGAMPRLIDEALEYMRTRKDKPLAPATQAQYAAAAKVLKHKMQEFDPGEVTPKDVVAIRHSLRDTPTAANTVLSFLSGVFQYALDQQLPDVLLNPTVGVKRFAHKERERLIRTEEFSAIYAQADLQLQVIMDLCIRTGQRIGSVIRIERANLLEEGIRFGRYKTDRKGVIAWTPELRDVIERARALPGAVRSLRWLFLGSKPDKPPSYSTIHRDWVLACKAAGIEDAQLRDLRAVAATVAKQQGKNPTALLLHASPRTTEIYLRAKEEPLIDSPTFGRKPS